MPPRSSTAPHPALPAPDGSADGTARPLAWLGAAHGLHIRVVAGLAIAWLVTGALARVGIPAVDPRLGVSARPLETFGTLAVCLPAALHAALLKNSLPWLTATSPRSPVQLRALWAAAMILVASVSGSVWVATLPAGVPRAHAFSLWLLIFGSAIVSVVLLRSDLAAVAPLVLIAAFTVRGLVPFSANAPYNVTLTAWLAGAAGLTLLGGAVAYAVKGDGQDS